MEALETSELATRHGAAAILKRWVVAAD